MKQPHVAETSRPWYERGCDHTNAPNLYKNILGLIMLVSFVIIIRYVLMWYLGTDRYNYTS